AGDRISICGAIIRVEWAEVNDAAADEPAHPAALPEPSPAPPGFQIGAFYVAEVRGVDVGRDEATQERYAAGERGSNTARLPVGSKSRIEGSLIVGGGASEPARGAAGVIAGHEAALPS